MKKIILSLAVVATLGLASCQPSAQKAEDEGAAIKAKIENCQDPDSLKIYVQQAKEYAEKLEKEGDATAAQAYLDEVTPSIQAKDPTMLSIFDTLKQAADSVVNTTKAAGDSVVSAGKEKVEGAVDAGKAALDNAAKDAKDKVDNAAKDAVNKANDAVQSGKDKASDAVQKGADKLKGVINGK